MPSDYNRRDDRYEPDDDYGYEDDYAGADEYDSHPLARRLFQVAVAVAAVALFLGVVWYAYLWGSGSEGQRGELPVVTADQSPEKVEPEDPGGMDVPHQDSLVMNENGQGTGEKVERLLPPPETPQPPEASAETEPSGDTAQSADQAQTVDSGDGQQVERTVEVEELPETTPDGGTTDTAESDMPETPPAPSESAAQGEAEAEEPAAEEPEQTQTAASEPTQSAPEPSESASTGTAADGDYAVQLAALRERAGAETAWQRLQQQYPELLGDLDLLLQSVEIEGRGTFWRVRTGPFTDKAAADALCGKLKAKGQDCLSVTR